MWINGKTIYWVSTMCKPCLSHCPHLPKDNPIIVITHFVVLCFITLHRCCIFYFIFFKLNVRTYTSNKMMTFFIVMAWNQSLSISKVCQYKDCRLASSKVHFHHIPLFRASPMAQPDARVMPRRSTKWFRWTLSVITSSPVKLSTGKWNDDANSE